MRMKIKGNDVKLIEAHGNTFICADVTNDFHNFNLFADIPGMMYCTNKNVYIVFPVKVIIGETVETVIANGFVEMADGKFCHITGIGDIDEMYEFSDDIDIIFYKTISSRYKFAFLPKSRNKKYGRIWESVSKKMVLFQYPTKSY